MSNHSHSSIAITTKPSVAKRPSRRKSTESAIDLTRIFNAPQAHVFRAWTEPALLKRWWAPKGWSTPYCTVDLRKGGVFHYCMHSPDGRDIWGRGIYSEETAPKKLVYRDSFSDEEGNLVEPSHYGMGADYPLETQLTVTFAKLKGRTRVTLRHDMPRSFGGRAQMLKGWYEMFDRLAELLAETTMEVHRGQTDTVFTRLFAVPRDRLFQAWIDPELLAEWWGPHGYTNPFCITEPRPGGTFHIIMRSPDGIDQSIKGQYLKVTAPEQIVFTDYIEKAPAEWLDTLNSYRHTGINAPPLLLSNTVLFADQDGKTRLTLTTCFDTRDDRYAIMKMGYAEGMAESLERLEELFTRCSMSG